MFVTYDDNCDLSVRVLDREGAMNKFFGAEKMLREYGELSAAG